MRVVVCRCFEGAGAGAFGARGVRRAVGWVPGGCPPRRSEFGRISCGRRQVWQVLAAAKISTFWRRSELAAGGMEALLSGVLTAQAAVDGAYERSPEEAEVEASRSTH